MANPTDLELAYFAGVIDSDGWITIITGAKQCVLRVGVGMTNPAIPMLLHEFFGGTLFTRNNRSKNPNWKNLVSWEVSAQKALLFLETIHQYLIIKKPQAEIGMRFQQNRFAGKRTVEQYKVDRLLDSVEVDRITSLNHRGN